ncbi:MAG: dCMP deaminase family protein [Deltaproteobacteria bacterium]|jgi:dCMP deaminase|nr:dCMP deaminase family protein [Deltaproteobacteria bacterium]
MPPLARSIIDLKSERLIGRPDWRQYFLAIAKIVSTRSTCSSRPVGCVIVRENRILVTGYNGAPSGEPHCTEQGNGTEIFCARRASKVSDEEKHLACPSVHAEENAVAIAERLGLTHLLAGCAIYTTLAPCVRCAKRLAAVGVREVYYEMAYESINRERDQEWLTLAKDTFAVFEKIALEETALNKIASALMNPTSARLLPSL